MRNRLPHLPGSLRTDVPHILYFNFLRICQAQRQFIAVNPQLHRIAHGRIFHHRHVALRNQSHIQKVLPQRTLAAHPADHGAFACL